MSNQWLRLATGGGQLWFWGTQVLATSGHRQLHGDVVALIYLIDCRRSELVATIVGQNAKKCTVKCMLQVHSDWPGTAIGTVGSKFKCMPTAAI